MGKKIPSFGRFARRQNRERQEDRLPFCQTGTEPAAGGLSSTIATNMPHKRLKDAIRIYGHEKKSLVVV
jgi:hypothetical protein